MAIALLSLVTVSTSLACAIAAGAYSITAAVKARKMRFIYYRKNFVVCKYTSCSPLNSFLRQIPSISKQKKILLLFSRIFYIKHIMVVYFTTTVFTLLSVIFTSCFTGALA